MRLDSVSRRLLYQRFGDELDEIAHLHLVVARLDGFDAIFQHPQAKWAAGADCFRAGRDGLTSSILIDPAADAVLEESVAAARTAAEALTARALHLAALDTQAIEHQTRRVELSVVATEVARIVKRHGLSNRSGKSNPSLLD